MGKRPCTLHLSTVWLPASRRSPFAINLKACYHYHVFEAGGWGHCFPEAAMQDYQSFFANPGCVPPSPNTHGADSLIRLKKGPSGRGEGWVKPWGSLRNSKLAADLRAQEAEVRDTALFCPAAGLGHFLSDMWAVDQEITGRLE